MLTYKMLKLLNDVRVKKEIERYKWIESEKVGRDIGKEKSALEWLMTFGEIWLKVHKYEEYKALTEEVSAGQELNVAR
ncbi:MAG: hypothetical protein V1674_06505 [Candidatus Omnitrophota bacterium]